MTGPQSKFSCLLVDDDPNIISLLESVFRGYLLPNLYSHEWEERAVANGKGEN